MNEPKKAAAKAPRLSAEWKQRIGLYGGILLILVIAAVIPRVYNNSKSVVLANPAQAVHYSGPSYWAEQQMIRSSIVSLSMTDPRWKDEPIADTGYTIGEQGSLLCCLAWDAPDEKVPSDINRALQAEDAYTENGGIDWDRANAALAPMRYIAYESSTPSFAANCLKEGKSVLLKIASADNRALWLWLHSADENGYYVVNPTAYGVAELLPPETRVYAVVVGEKD